MNPLIESCSAITKAAYNKSAEFQSPFKSPLLTSLGMYLLKGSGVGWKDLLIPKALPDANSVAICFGSGIDSYCAIHRAMKEDWETIFVIHIDYGQPYAAAENHVFRSVEGGYYKAGKGTSNWSADFDRHVNYRRFKFIKLTIPLVPMDVKGLDWENYIIPGRNLVLAAMASEYSRNIWIVANKRSDEGAGTPDKTSHFFGVTSQIFSNFYGWQYRVSSPYLLKSKLEMVQEYLAQGGSVEALKHTFSCYGKPELRDIIGTEKLILHCGWCYACFKRYHLFQALNTEYSFVKPPQDGPNWLAYKAKEAAKGRCESTSPAAE